ncbi:MAG: hypothetical protein ACRDVM_00695, partial [Acidimicrobiia bacterium]
MKVRRALVVLVWGLLALSAVPVGSSPVARAQTEVDQAARRTEETAGRLDDAQRLVSAAVAERD